MLCASQALLKSTAICDPMFDAAWAEVYPRFSLRDLQSKEWSKLDVG
jgi:hypothetical protein